MPYTDNAQLPEAVRNSLADTDQTQWREIFNNAYSTACNGDDQCAAKVAWSQMKKNARHFAGWASVEMVDRQGDVVEIGAFQKTLDFFMATGATMMDQHSNRRVGSWINYEFRNKMCSDGIERPGVYLEGVVFKGQRIYDDVWDKVCKKEYADLSIGADPLEQGRACTAKECFNAVKNMDLFEVSPVEVGANQEASIEEVNHVSKSDITIIGDTMAEEPTKIEKAAEVPAVDEPSITKSDEILTILKGLDGRMSALEDKLSKEDGEEEDEDKKEEDEEEEDKKEEDEEEEDMEEKSAEPTVDIGAAVEKALDKALEKKLLTKEADTPRPELNKNELQKSQDELMKSVEGKGYKQISAIVDNDAPEARPW